MESFVFEQQVLFRADFLSVTSDYRVQCAMVGLGVIILNILDFFYFYFLACCQGSKPVFISFSDTQCLFLDVAFLVQISKGSLFLHLMTIGANNVHS